MLVLLICQGCEESVESEVLPIVIQGESEVAMEVENLLKSNPHIIYPDTGREYTMQIVTPDPSKKYCILQVTPDPDVHYTIKFVEPKKPQSTMKLDPKLRDAIIDSLKQRIETPEEP